MGFKENLKQYREGLGITAKDFARQIGVRYTTYVNYENVGTEPKYETLIKIATALHVSVDDLLGYTPDKFAYWQSVIKRDGFTIEDMGDNVKVTSGSFTIDSVPKKYFVDVLEAIESDIDDLLKPSRTLMIESKIHEFVIDSVLFDVGNVKENQGQYSIELTGEEPPPRIRNYPKRK